MLKYKDLWEQAAAKATEAKKIAEDSGGRELTAEEKQRFTALMTEAKELKGKGDDAKADHDILAQASQIAALTGAANDEAGKQLTDALSGKFGGPDKIKYRNLGHLVIESDGYKQAMAPFKGQDLNNKHFQTNPIPVPLLGKSLFTGGSDTSAGAFVVADQSGIVEMLGRRPLTVRDIISVRTTGSDAVEYVQQTSHTNAAAPVAEATSSAFSTAPGTAGALVPVAGGGYKPEGAWAFVRVSTTVKTIAEWVPATKRALADASQLEGLIRDELQADLAEVEETQILNGNGSGENFDGITHVTGTQTQAFDTDMFRSIRKAITKARVVGRVIPNAILMNPADLETMDLYRLNQGGGAGTGDFLGAGPFGSVQRTLWGYPVVESEAQTAGQAVVGDFRKAVLWDREQSTVTMTDSHLDYFTRNLVAILAEERAAFGVTRPSAFVLTALA